MSAPPASSSMINRAILVSALGYFVDLFDIQLFAVLRVASLTDIGVPPDQQARVGGNILNAQLLGMIIGAFLWGWLGDRYGRLKALYGSILIYSLGTFACAFVQDPVTYGVLRFITGFGLAGETGAVITLIAELMPPKKRGWGITIVGAIAFLGPAAAVVISWHTPWRETYIVTGLLGIGLFFLRMKLLEPLMFQKMQTTSDQRGSLKLLLQPKQLRIFLYCLIVGGPLIFAWQFLNFFSVEFAKAILPEGAAFNQKICLLVFFIGSSMGDVAAGALSQFMNSRKKPLALFFAGGLVVTIVYLLIGPQLLSSAKGLYIIYFCSGLAAGSWILLAMMTAEQFGTNIRATTAITLTNLVRGFTIPIIFVFQSIQDSMGATNAAALIGVVLYICAFWALRQLRDTHGTDLDYLEELSPPTGGKA